MNAGNARDPPHACPTPQSKAARERTHSRNAARSDNNAEGVQERVQHNIAQSRDTDRENVARTKARKRQARFRQRRAATHPDRETVARFKARERQARYRKRHAAMEPAHARKKQAEYSRRHPDVIRHRQAQFERDRPDVRRQLHAQYRRHHPDVNRYSQARYTKASS